MMNLKKLASALALAGIAAVASVPAQAAYVVLDGWQLVTPVATTTNIGRLNLVSGTATVEQEVDAGGNVFVGAEFRETGAIFSISYTTENVVGAGDSGAPGGLGETLTISFADVGGVVTALNSGGGFAYNFTSGSFLIEGAGGVDYASGSIVGIGGNASSTAVIGGFNGDSTLLATVLAQLNAAFDLRDSSGTSLLPAMASGEVLFEAVTNNNVTDQLGVGGCSFDAAAICATFSVASAGDAYLVRQVPEPGSLALAGLALFGAASLGRRAKKK
jgi:hypothetical protein